MKVFVTSSKLHRMRFLASRSISVCLIGWLMAGGIASPAVETPAPVDEPWKALLQDRSPSTSTESALPRYSWWVSDPEMYEITTEVVTPHTPWARPYAGHQLRLVVIAPRWTQRATVELQQRFDFVATPIMAKFAGTWSDSNTPDYAWLPHGTETETTANALAALRGSSLAVTAMWSKRIAGTQPPDAIVIGALSCSILPEAVEQAILDAVSHGSALILFNVSDVTPRLQALLDGCSTSVSGDVDAVVDGIPLRGLLTENRSPREIIGNWATFHETKAGARVVVVRYTGLTAANPSPLINWYINCYFSPSWSVDDESMRDIYYDYYSSFAGRCILWAARELPEVQLTGWERLPSEVDVQNAPVPYGALSIESTSLRPQGLTAELTIRDEDATVEHRERIPITADGNIVLSLPQLKAGGHFLDVILRNPEGRSLDWGSSYFTCRTDADVVSMRTEKKSYTPGEPVPLEIKLRGNLAGARLDVEISDTLGRLLWTASVDARPEMLLDAKLTGALTIQCEARATLRRGSTIMATRSHKILVRQPVPPEDKFIYCAWAGIDHSFVRRRVAETMAAQGITSGVIFGDMDEWAGLNVRPTVYATRYAQDGQEHSRIRQPCFNDPVFIQSETSKLKDCAERMKNYSPLAYSLGDDVSMLSTHQDACICPNCLNDFRKYLAGQYGGIEALNRSWRTAYTSFDEVMPSTLEEATAGGNFPAWADHRMYMDQLFVKMLRLAKGAIQDVDPGARVGFEGPLADESWQGYLWKEMMDTVDLMVPYPNAWKFDLVRSFGRPGLLSGGWYGGYAMYRNGDDDGRSYPWFLLFNGCNSYWFFSDYATAAGGHPSEGLAPDLRVLPCLSAATREVQRIQTGIDRLVLGAKRETDAVAVYFSRPSVHASTVTPAIPLEASDKTTQYLAAPEQKWALNTEAMLRLLDDVGLSYTFVDRNDIAAGRLQKGKYRLLVMPYVQAMSSDEAAAVRKFVQDGGCVLADVRPGLFDEHVRLLEKGRLDGLFGIARQGSALDPLQAEPVRWASGGTEDVMPVDPTVRLAAGTSAIRSSKGAPLFIKSRYRKGSTMLLNMSLQHYLLTLRPEGRGEGVRSLLLQWLDEKNMVPSVRVETVGEGRSPVNARVFRYDDDGIRLVGLLRSHKRVMDDPDAFVDRSPKPVNVSFGREGYIYDVINHRRWGKGSSLQMELPVATPFLFAVLPYRVVDVGVAARQKGRTVNVQASVKTSGSKTGRHVIRIQIVDADGRKRPEYEMAITTRKGRAVGSFDLALNDPSGRWDIYAEDVIAGVIGRQHVEILQGKP